MYVTKFYSVQFLKSLEFYGQFAQSRFAFFSGHTTDSVPQMSHVGGESSVQFVPGSKISSSSCTNFKTRKSGLKPSNTTLCEEESPLLNRTKKES